MNSTFLIFLSVILLTVAAYCIFLMIQFSKKIAGMKGEKQTEELEDLDKLRAELIETNRKLRSEITRLKKELEDRNK